MRRRDFLRAVSVSSGAVVLAPTLWQSASAAPRQGASGAEGPYGSLDGREPDENGLLLPEGFTSTIIARADEPVADTDYRWPAFPDGAATFPADDGGWYLAVNTESPVPGSGGVSSLVFDADGAVVDGYRILDDTLRNCAGGPTPWGTWLSCEEHDVGVVWECDPSQPGQGEARPAMGAFTHEAVTVDPDNERLFLTEDQPDGRLYRFTPADYPDLSAGTLEVAEVDDEGSVTWHEVPDPTGASDATRKQVAESTAFNGGEGVWFDQGSVYFSTKGDNNVWHHDVAAETIESIYDGSGELTGVDNITIEPGTGDLFIAEDGGNMEIVLLTPEGEAFPFARVVDEGIPADGLVSELTGPAFSPDGKHLYFASQRGGPANVGISYAVTGPFRAADAATTSTSTTATTLAAAAAPPTTAAGATDDDDDSGSAALPLVGGAMVLGLAATGAAVWRVRTRRTKETEEAAVAGVIAEHEAEQQGTGAESDEPGSR